MKRQRRKKCKNCKELFHPDSRNVRHQQFCGKSECRQASKRQSQARWHRKPENRDYFRGPAHVERVREWRAAHPGYWKRRVLQDVLVSQVAVTTEESGTYNSSTDVLCREGLPTSTLGGGNKNNWLATICESSSGEGKRASALQDVLPVEKGGQSAVFIGLIGKLIGSTLQDDIAFTVSALLRLGQNILHGGGNGGETASDARAGATHSEGELQLG